MLPKGTQYSDRASRSARHIRKAVEDRKVKLLTLFEFSKALDCIPYKKLLLKLRMYNLSDAAIKWLYGYSIDRYQTGIASLLESPKVPSLALSFLPYSLMISMTYSSHQTT